MRIYLKVLIPILFLIMTGFTQRPWQKITEPSLAEIAANFKTPPPEYSLTFYWGWNDTVTAEVIARDLDAFKERNVHIVTIEPGYRMKDPYLSPNWFETVRLAVELARQRNMRVWLVDEGKYPSGFAGGKFSTERPDLRMQALVVAERIEVASGETLSRKLSPETVSAVAFNLADSSSQILDASSGQLSWTAPEGQWQVLLVQHQFRTSPTRAVNNADGRKDTTNSLCDYLNPEATRQFIKFTHEQYKKYVGSEFGRTILGFRGDEPDYSIRGIPWTNQIFAEFQRRKGYDVRPYIASFFTPHLTDEQRRVKADYWDVWSDMFGENFFRVQAEWCARNNLAYLVHLNHEDKMVALVRSEGDFFKAMRHVPMPGIDAIWNQIWPDRVADFPKYASSAAHLFGRPRAFTESFAAYHIRPNVEQAKWVLNHQLVRGINMVEVMFVPASSKGELGLSGWLETEQFPDVAAYIHRASYLLSQGRPTAQIALYHPTSSLWLGDEEANTSVLMIAQQLLEHQHDFDFVDEQALSSVLTLDNGTLKNLSGQSYRAVIIPSVSAISKKALVRLQAFAASGGQVLFLGRLPSLVVEKTFLKANGPMDLSWAIREPSGELTPRVIEALPEPDVKLSQPCPSVKYLHRRWRDAELYFFFNESSEKQECEATLLGSGQVQIWDAMSGIIKPVPGASPENGAVRLPLVLEPYETKFIVIEALPK
ncbi:MAG: glycosyl hydrolase [candidate division KSB1 bacterium]|nr:glycosyl hydrolase [candidate division KSB1 bacterium]